MNSQKSLKSLSLPRLGAEELALVHGGRSPWLLALAAIPFCAAFRMAYRTAEGSTVGAFKARNPGWIATLMGKGPLVMEGSLSVQRKGFSFDFSGELQASPRPPAKVGG